MATRQYIGARYVPKFYQNSVDGSTQWEQNVVYEPLMYVTLTNGHMYMSKKQVPATVGSPVNNIDYWLDIGSYNGIAQELQTQIDDLAKLDEFITPYHFGAVGDGVADDTTAFVSMLNNNSKPILLNKGTFKISSQLNIPSNATIIGTKESLLLNNISVGTAGSFNYLFNIENKNNVVIDGINIKGAAQSITQGHSQYKTCINIVSSNNIEIKNCSFVWCDDMYVINAKNSNYISYINNFINHYHYIGLSLLITCKHCKINNNIVMNCDNYSYNNNGQCYPISFSGFDTPLTDEEMNDDVVIDGNKVIQENYGTWEGISGHGGNNITIVNNYVKGTYSGICIDSSDTLNFSAENVIIANNYVNLTESNYLDVVKHNEAIVVGGKYIDVHDNILIHGGYAGSLLADYDDPMAVLVRGCKNVKIHSNIFRHCRGNLFKFKLDNIDIHIYNNDVSYFYWLSPYGSLKACLFNLHEATELKSLIVENNTIERFDNNDWFVFGKTGDSTSYATDPYILFRNNKLLTARSLIKYSADNIIYDQSDITHVTMGKVGDIIYNPDAANSGDVYAWLCTKEWRNGSGGVWTPMLSV